MHFQLPFTHGEIAEAGFCAAVWPVASILLDLRADSELETRIDHLRRKANSGTLTPAEEAEYKDFVEAVDLISVMQAKARRFLAKQSA
jgi:hypothetical protein